MSGGLSTARANRFKKQRPSGVKAASVVANESICR